MPSKLERFTDYSRVVLNVAQQTAEQEMHHKTLSAEHILIGMINSPGVAGEVLRGLGLEADVVSSWVVRDYVDKPRDPSKAIELTDSTKKLLELAVDEARRIGQIHITTGHMLLGMLWQHNDILDKTLVYLGLDKRQLRVLTKEAMYEYNDPKDRIQVSPTAKPRPVAPSEPSRWYRFTSKLMLMIGIKPLDPLDTSENRLGQSDGTIVIKCLTALIDDGKPSVHLFVYRGTLNLQRNNYSAAEQDYSDAIRLKPDFGFVYCQRGFARSKTKDYTGAIADYTEMIRLRYFDYLAYSNRGWIYLNQLDHERAMADFEKAIQLKTDSLSAYNGRASVFLSKRDLDRAIAEYDEILRRDPDNNIAHDNRGTARAHNNDFDGAEADFREVLTQDPEKSRSHSNLGWLALLRQEYDKAIDYCNEAIRLEATNGPAYYSRGAAQAAQGNSVGAVADYRQSLTYWTNINSPLCAYILHQMQTYLDQWDTSAPEIAN